MHTIMIKFHIFLW